jgi:hypothetical protein
MPVSPYLKYPHTNLSEDTLEKFFYKNQPLTNDLNIVDFLRCKGGTEETNATRIFNNYTKSNKSKYNNLINSINGGISSEIDDKSLNKLPLISGTILYFPKSNFKEEVVSVQGKNLFLTQRSPKYFFAEKLYKLLTTSGYVAAESLKISGREIDVDTINENLQVWVWMRALNKIINVSPFIQDMTTNKSEIGTFSLSLNPIHNVEDLEFTSDKDILSFFTFNKGSDHEIDFFHKNIQYNDIVFIRFEKLELEKSRKETFENHFEVNKSELPNQVWDMIGLVDGCPVNSSFAASDYTISIEGRDLMKLLVEDGSYFMPMRFLAPKDKETGNIGNFVFGYQQDDKWFKRNFVTGAFDSQWFTLAQRSIGDTVGFIINQLSNLGILAGEDLFSNYSEDKRTTQYQVTGVEDSELKTQLVDGIWQIIKIMYDQTLEDRRVGDASIAFVDSTIIDQFNKICQKPFVEFIGDTYGDEFNFVVRQPPFNRSAITSFLKGSNDEAKSNSTEEYKIIEIEAKDVMGVSGIDWDQTYYSWYQLCPNDAMLGANTEIMMGGFIPIVYFERIAEIFGNHKMVVQDNYLFANVISANGSVQDNNIYRRSLLNDLKFVVDSNVYLPFTRKGTIQLVKGDRRIKRGMFIRYKPTKEIFYVDSVTNSISFEKEKINRSTTIQVSRGMIEDYIYGSIGYNDDGSTIKVGGKDKLFSYFDIANTGIVSKTQTQNPDSSGTVKSTPVVPASKSFVKINQETEQWRKLVVKYFPIEEIDNALRIIFKESSGNPIATHINSDYELSVDNGLFQINTKYHPEVYDAAVEEHVSIFDPEFNIKWGFQIWKDSKRVNGFGWQPWATAKIPGVIYKSSYTEQQAPYVIKMNESKEDSHNHNNPAAILNVSTKKLIDYITPEDGYKDLLKMIQYSIARGSETVDNFIKNLVNYSLIPSNHLRYLKARTSFIGQQVLKDEVDRISLSDSVSNIDVNAFAKDLIWVQSLSVIKYLEFIPPTENENDLVSVSTTIEDDQYDFSLNDEQFDFFLKRKQFNLQKFRKR